MRCPLEDTGKNSVRPWTTPSMMAWRTGMLAPDAVAAGRATAGTGTSGA
jgi:hypothetical protein